MSGALVVRGDSHHLPLADESVDLIVTSPPYFAQRSYKDGDAHMAGQVGDELHPQEFLDALWSVMHECWRVLKPTGSVFVNLGDKRSGSGAPGTTSGFSAANGSTPRSLDRGAGGGRPVQGERSGIQHGYTRGAFGRSKSKQLIPQRFAIGCEDGLADPCPLEHEHADDCSGIGWIVRAEMVWWKRNGLPESVRDRVRDAHEVFWHLTKQGEYYSAIDELREPHKVDWTAGVKTPSAGARQGDSPIATGDSPVRFPHPLGRLPESVWHIATEPLLVPAHLGVEHFAAFPSEWPRRLVLGWSPPGICLECGEGRRPVVEKERHVDFSHVDRHRGPGAVEINPDSTDHDGAFGRWISSTAQILGYACACTPFTDHEGSGDSSESYADALADGRYATKGQNWGGQQNLAARPRTGGWREYHLERWTAPPMRPAIVLDPFGGTGTTAMVARALGRIGISVDLSADYSRLARWRIFESGHGAKAVQRTNAERQGTLL